MTPPRSDAEEPILYRPPRGPREYAGLVARGFAMGSADVVPGVSGGTMAFILGIYEELIDATRKLTEPEFLRPLSRGRLDQALASVPWAFLLSVLGGILLAVFSLASALEWTLAHYPERLWAFFFGLVVASIFTVSRRLDRWTPAASAMAVLGALGAWVVVGLVPVETPMTPLFVLGSGVIAICAMVLPGISGSFILILLGKYQQILSAVTQRDFPTLAIFAAGAGLGILGFARFLSWLLARFHDLTVAFLIGLMAGSLRKVWPWKEVLETVLDRHGEAIPIVERNVMAASGTEAAIGIGLALLGLAAVVAMEAAGSVDRRR